MTDAVTAEAGIFPVQRSRAVIERERETERGEGGGREKLTGRKNIHYLQRAAVRARSRRHRYNTFHRAWRPFAGLLQYINGGNF